MIIYISKLESTLIKFLGIKLTSAYKGVFDKKEISFPENIFEKSKCVSYFLCLIWYIYKKYHFKRMYI